MASPSSSKRKRSNSHLHAGSVPKPKPSSVDSHHPSSRDASGEDADESAAALSSAAMAAPPTTVNSIPPTKRPRIQSLATEDPFRDSDDTQDAGRLSIGHNDPGEHSETTEASIDIENRAKRRIESRPSISIPKPRLSSGLVDPQGYHTNPPPKGRPVRVYADGVFDLFHLGHMRQLEQAKKAIPDTYLIVGVTSDAETHKRKGLTVLNGAERAETVRHCKWVDEVIPNCPWIVSPEFLEEHQIDYVAHDDLPYGAAEGDDIYAPIKEKGKFLVTQRTEGVSTTGIITKVVRDYDKYIARQFKRGASRQELNVSWLKKNELEIKRHVAELRDTIRTNWSTTGQELGKELRHLWQTTSPARQSLDLHSPGISGNNNNNNNNNNNIFWAGGSTRSHLQPDIPSRPGSPGVAGRSEDFATGYSLGLIGGVRSWMMRSRTSLRDSMSQPVSPSGSDEDADRNTSGESNN